VRAAPVPSFRVGTIARRVGTEQVEYDDYRDVGGVQLPFSVRTSDGAPYDTVTRAFLQIRRNVPVDDALFRLTSPRQSTCDCC
jgi:hypothetical protein